MMRICTAGRTTGLWCHKREVRGWQRQAAACRWFAHSPSAKPSALPLPPASITASSSCTHGSRASGFTIVEAVISTFIVGIMFVAALNTVATARLTQHRAALTSRGRLFAETLLSEIRAQSYKDSGANPVFGPETGESTATRADFDDVDDYSGWSGAPTAKDGTALVNSAGWLQTVTVQWIDRLNPSSVQATETGAKRITVTTSFNSVPQVTLVAIRTAKQ